VQPAASHLTVIIIFKTLFASKPGPVTSSPWLQVASSTFLIHTDTVKEKERETSRCKILRPRGERAMIYEQRETQKVSPHTVHNFNQLQRARSLALYYILHTAAVCALFAQKCTLRLDEMPSRILCNHIQQQHTQRDADPLIVG
jgi:hypothetical protein